MALWGSTGWRIVANDFSCPNSNGPGACMDTVESSSLDFYGNNVHDTGTANASALYHGVYFGTDSNHLDIGWNTVADVHGCRGIQIHSTPQSGEPASGQNQYDIRSTTTPFTTPSATASSSIRSIHPRELFRYLTTSFITPVRDLTIPNRAGTGLVSMFRRRPNDGPSGSGMVDIYNNTLYACGTFASPPYGNANAGIAYGGGNARDLFAHSQ